MGEGRGWINGKVVAMTILGEVADSEIPPPQEEEISDLITV